MNLNMESEMIPAMITIPDGFELISREEHDRLEADKQIMWDLKKAIEVTGFSKKELTMILQSFKQGLDVDHGGCVYYPYNGGKYKIESSKFIKFIRVNFKRIMETIKG
ncbi:DUF771 domain-containing protein [Dellaglioa algida]|uniref:DUF771 domain-containing protein n=1 Tax=Dellaglioa algida TaxID=105612 RepID=UPI0024C4840D|nr:DUF771 domain-containing protein [Dellaglioa algida]MDK1716601.1 DUF771 domain-containing protein [Dellaglioa algida]MDK1721543.1 DUF771 domain-containing protein [Dellaglioa algida]